MEKLDICQQCSEQKVKWLCTTHNMKVCSMCNIKEHQQCSKVDPFVEQVQSHQCIACEQSKIEIVCRNHQLQLCEKCFYQEHKTCEEILPKEYSKFKEDFIQKLKSSIIDQYFKDRQTKNEEITKVINSIIQQLNMIQEQIVQLNKQTDEFTQNQLKELDIHIGKSNTQSINQLYLEKCNRIEQEIEDQVLLDLKKVNQDTIKMVEQFNQNKLNKYSPEQFKKDVEFPLDDFATAFSLNRNDCKYILPSNSTQDYVHTIIFNKATKELYAVGQNNNGQLGLGHQYDQDNPVKITNNFSNQKILQISCGGYHTIILSDVGVYSFGSNSEGQLGNGTKTDQNIPINITQQFQGEKVKIISCGFYHSAAITQKDHLFTFGQNTYGQLGDNSTGNKSTPVNITANIFSNNNNNNGNSNNNNTNKQEESEEFLNVSCGLTHTIVQTNKSLYAFGSNQYGKLGIGKQKTVVQKLPIKIDSFFENGTVFRQVQCGHLHTIVLTNKGVFTFGYNVCGQLGNNSMTNSFAILNITDAFQNEKILSINAGFQHNIVQTVDNLYSFGYGGCGSLGDGSTQTKIIPIKITYQFQGQKIKQIQCLGNHNLIETDKGLYGFGENSRWQLGDGKFTNITDPIFISGYFN